MAVILFIRSVRLHEYQYKCPLCEKFISSEVFLDLMLACRVLGVPFKIIDTNIDPEYFVYSDIVEINEARLPVIVNTDKQIFIDRVDLYSSPVLLKMLFDDITPLMPIFIRSKRGDLVKAEEKKLDISIEKAKILHYVSQGIKDVDFIHSKTMLPKTLIKQTITEYEVKRRLKEQKKQEETKTKRKRRVVK